ncbi:peptidase inhibitor family I36 protein [Streptomyces angustmyceticus]|uniref:peptidase inhibitor family I36 protein n=1 Tax=Streptomyces angustmyceticus TaxID=285578 RepID=UPI00344D6398
MSRQRERSLTSIALALVLGALGFTAPAQAAPSCPAESLCSYSGSALSGRLTVVPASSIERAGTRGVQLPASARSFFNGTHFTVRYGPARQATCVRFPCYQYATLGKVTPGAQLRSLPYAASAVTVGRDYGN